MRLIFGLVLLAGLSLAGFAVYMAKNYIGAYQAALAEERKNSAQVVPIVPVFVAKRQLSYGEQLTKADVRLVKWPQDALPEGAFTRQDPAVSRRRRTPLHPAHNGKRRTPSGRKGQ